MAKIGTCGNRNPFVLPEWAVKPVQTESDAMKKLCKRISAQVQSIYYPCCFTDRSLEDLFPNTHITYLDINPSSFLDDTPERNTVVGNANDFVCKTKVDLGVLLSPTLFPERFLESIKQNGYVIADNRHGSAKMLKQETGASLIGCESLKAGWIGPQEAREYMDEVDPSDILSLSLESLYLFAKR